MSGKGKGKGKKSKGGGAKGVQGLTLAHGGKASNLLAMGMPNKSTGLHSWGCSPNQDEFCKLHLYGHILEMPKAFTLKDVKDGSSQELPFTMIKAELKVPISITPTVEWFITELHTQMCCVHDYLYLQLPDREWTLQCVAPGVIPTMVEYLEHWLPGNKMYIKNCSCKLSQHSMNYILMSKYFSAKVRPSAMTLIHIFHHPHMLKSITFPDSIMGVKGNEWTLKDPNMGCHSFGTRKGNICPLVNCRCLFSDSRMLCQHILKHYGHIWGCDKCQEYCSWDTGAAYDHWTSHECSEWKGKLLLIE